MTQIKSSCGHGISKTQGVTCPDCNHHICDWCTGKVGMSCHCKLSYVGEAYSDQRDKRGRNWIKKNYFYKGPFKSYVQQQMEEELIAGDNYMNAKSYPRIEKCGYAYCSYNHDSCTKKVIIHDGYQFQGKKLTDDNANEFVTCEKCRSVG